MSVETAQSGRRRGAARGDGERAGAGGRDPPRGEAGEAAAASADSCSSTATSVSCPYEQLGK